MRKILYLIILYIPFLLVACDVHEWPETPENVDFHLRLHYETEMTKWEHQYDNNKVVEKGYGEIYDNHLNQGKIRYIIRAYPITRNQHSTKEYTREFVITKDVSKGYDHEVTLQLPGGDYDIMVWSDLLQSDKDSHFYNADNFSEIEFKSNHKGNTDYRDAFRGTESLSLVADIKTQLPDTLDITMQRPLAKHELVTTDLQKFIDKELEYLSKLAESRGEDAPTRVETDKYKVLIYYVGYMPDTYNMNADKPVDSSMGNFIESKLNILNNEEASFGFDYTFVGNSKSSVMIQIGLFDGDREIAYSDLINVPLLRSHHTILRGTFLTQEASGGIIINPDFDGNHNITIQ